MLGTVLGTGYGTIQTKTSALMELNFGYQFLLVFV